MTVNDNTLDTVGHALGVGSLVFLLFWLFPFFLSIPIFAAIYLTHNTHNKFNWHHKIWNAIKNSAAIQDPAELNEPLLQKCPQCKGAQKYWNGNTETDCDCKDGKTPIICDATFSHFHKCQNNAYVAAKIFWPMLHTYLCKQHLSGYNSVPKFVRALSTFFLFVPLAILFASITCSDEPETVFLFGILVNGAVSVLGGYFLLLVLGLKNE